MSDDEQWRQTPDGAYEVSDLGRIRRLRQAKGAVVGAIIKTRPQIQKYENTSLSVEGIVRKVWVHRLIAEIFLGPCPVGMQVNHKDGDKHNNRLSNLEYVSPRDNIQHAIKTGLRKPQPEETRCKGEKNYGAKLTNKEVMKIRSLRKKGMSVAHLCEIFPVNRHAIFNIVARRTWKHLP